MDQVVDQLRFQRAVVVEDHDETRTWLTRALAEAFDDIPIQTFSNLGAARAWLRDPPAGARLPSTLWLIDLALPDGSGASLIRELSRTYPNAVPVVTTIHDDDARLFEAIEAGAKGYLLKSDQPDRFVQTLARLERGEPPLSPSIARRILAHFQAAAPARTSQQTDRATLTTRETEVLSLIGRGLRIAEVANELGLTRNTVSGYVKMIYSKLDISSRAEAAVEAMKRGLM